ncbi:MAG TPA: AGE family epimerase/isomerase [Mariniflexile sp.]|nr:AGE family epimerase/isomerase [Mariniflexile sp.]
MKNKILYKNALLNNIIPFWENHSLDLECGGYYTCLDRTGKVYDTDKFMWLQGRQAWTFSMLYNLVEKNENWLKIAKHGIDFIIKHGMDADGNFYFSTTREGKPLVQPYNIFSDCFAAMAFGQYAKASGDENIRQLAKQTYLNILKKKDNPKGIYEKSTNARPLKSFSLPMILSNLVLELEGVLDADEVNKTIDFSINEVMHVFLDKKSGLIYEFVRPDGSHEDSFNGRLLNPGHGIEAMWFMIDIGVRRNDTKLIEKAADTIIKILDYSWDEKYGGMDWLFDAHGKTPPQLGWDPKLWGG